LTEKPQLKLIRNPDSVPEQSPHPTEQSSMLLLGTLQLALSHFINDDPVNFNHKAAHLTHCTYQAVHHRQLGTNPSLSHLVDCNFSFKPSENAEAEKIE
jgi:hypothetical protein